jgi:hypothetical protein
MLVRFGPKTWCLCSAERHSRTQPFVMLWGLNTIGILIAAWKIADSAKRIYNIIYAEQKLAVPTRSFALTPWKIDCIRIAIPQRETPNRPYCFAFYASSLINIVVMTQSITQHIIKYYSCVKRQGTSVWSYIFIGWCVLMTMTLHESALVGSHTGENFLSTIFSAISSLWYPTAVEKAILQDTELSLARNISFAEH